MLRSSDRLQTRIIHAGEHPRIAGAITTPIFQTAMFETDELGDYHSNRYIRLNNTPNHIVLHAKLSALEEGEAALVAASGMAAISTTLSTVLGTNGHVLCQQSIYGGTYDLLAQQFPNWGLSHDAIDATNPAHWQKALKPTTRAIYVETLTNPTLQVADFESVVQFARQNKLVSIIDNTFASPVNFQPIKLGFDVVLHSCSKYLNGHSDLVAGAVIGRANLVDAVHKRLNILGGTLDPHACYLLQRGMKTLALRVAHQSQSALKIARFLAESPAVERIYYPGLSTHPGHERAARLFKGFGGMIALELKGGRNTADRFMKHLRLITNTVSLGGVESLITLPAATAHAGLSQEQQAAMGISAGMMRISVGLEDSDDLIADIAEALARC